MSDDQNLSIASTSFSLRPKKDDAIISIPSFIRKRQHDRMSSASECMRINDVFLPNTMRTVDRCRAKICSGLYSDDGNKFLSIMQRNVIAVYDTSTPQFKRTRHFSCNTVGWMIDGVFSPCSRYILYYTWPTRTIFLHDLEKETEEESTPMIVHTKTPCGAVVFSMKFSPDGKEYLTGASDCSILIQDIETQSPVLYFHGHRSPVNSVAFADNSSQTIITGGEDGYCRIWDRRCLNENNPSSVGVLIGHKLGVLFIDPKKDGRQFLSNSKDQTAKLWDIRHCSEKEEGRSIPREFRMWDFRRDAIPTSLSEDREPLPNDASIMTYRGHILRRTLMRCRFSPTRTTEQRYVYAGSADGKIVIYNTLTGKVVTELKDGFKNCMRDVHWHPYRSEIAGSCLDGNLGIWTYMSPDAADEYKVRPKRIRLGRRSRRTENRD